MPLHRRPSLKRNPEPRGTDKGAGADHAESRPFVLPQRRGADGKCADDQRIGHEQRVVARPDGFPLRIDQVDIGLEDRDLVGRADSVFIGHSGGVCHGGENRASVSEASGGVAIMRMEKAPSGLSIAPGLSSWRPGRLLLDLSIADLHLCLSLACWRGHRPEGPARAEVKSHDV